MVKKTGRLMITRIFDAPVKSVWEAWTKPEQVMRWWGPQTFTAPTCKIDFRSGGKYLFVMRSDSGPEIWKKGIWSTGVYKEIEPLKKIVYSDSFADENGNVVSATYYGMKGFPRELQVTLNFQVIKGGKTKMTLIHAGMPANTKEEARKGWNESFDKLDAVLASPATEVYRSVTPLLIIRGAREALEFYKNVFNAQVTFLQNRPDGKVLHAEIKIGDTILMLADECSPHDGHETNCDRSPSGLGGTTVNFYYMVDDADKIFNRAVESGAIATMPVADMFWGDRVGAFRDPFGHSWSVATHKEDVSLEQMKKRMDKLFAQKQEPVAEAPGTR